MFFFRSPRLRRGARQDCRAGAQFWRWAVRFSPSSTVMTSVEGGGGGGGGPFGCQPKGKKPGTTAVASPICRAAGGGDNFATKIPWRDGDGYFQQVI